LLSISDLANCRYLPDADLPTVVIDDEFIQRARESLPPSSDIATETLIRPPYNLHPDYARKLAVSTELLSYFNAVVAGAKDLNPRSVAHWYLSYSIGADDVGSSSAYFRL